MIKLLKFGSPEVQSTYQNLCDLVDISFDDFQEKLIEDTDKSYDQLKEYYVDGVDIALSEAEVEDFEETEIDNYLIIHFDTNKREILGIIPDSYPVYTDGFSYYEEDTFNKEKTIRSSLRQFI